MMGLSRDAARETSTRTSTKSLVWTTGAAAPELPEVPRVALPLLWWLQARTRSFVLESQLRDARRAAPNELMGSTRVRINVRRRNAAAEIDRGSQSRCQQPNLPRVGRTEPRHHCHWH